MIDVHSNLLMFWCHLPGLAIFPSRSIILSTKYHILHSSQVQADGEAVSAKPNAKPKATGTQKAKAKGKAKPDKALCASLNAQPGL